MAVAPATMSSLDPTKMPRHVAIIMDGNGRWAHQRGLPRVDGHAEGAKSVHAIVRACRALNISALTLFAFSEQNWERPQDEVDALMGLLHRYVLDERDEILDNDIRLTVIGDIARLPAYVRQALDVLMKVSAKNKSMTLVLALSYGGREDLTQAARRLAEEVAAGTITPDEIDEEHVNAHLSTADLPPVDLLLRTSGEQRISNFLLWQAAYAELIFLDTMWPDFREPQLHATLAEYQRRERRFGLTSEQLTSKGSQR